METAQSLDVLVPEDGQGQRIDKWLSQLPEIGTRSRASALIEKGCVTHNGKLARASLILKTGDQIQVRIPEAQPATLSRLELQLDILFEDQDLLVVNKPSGLVVHPAAGHAQDTLVNALIAHTDDLSMGFGESRPGIIHRLDKETSGLLVVAKNDAAQESLAQQFRERSIVRLYEALCFGRLKPEEGQHQSWLARHPTERKKMASVRTRDGQIERNPKAIMETGKWALTRHKVLGFNSHFTLAELKLETGRTHQIRVHLSEAGHPLVGDALYGSNARAKSLGSPKLRNEVLALTRFFLHAKELGFRHPRTSEALHFRKDWPEPELNQLISWGLR